MPNETNNPKDGLEENVNNLFNPRGAAPVIFRIRKRTKTKKRTDIKAAKKTRRLTKSLD